MGDELDDLSFVIAFLLPFRVLFLTGARILGWAVNLHGPLLLGVDGVSSLDPPTIERTPRPLVVDGRHSAQAQAHGTIDQLVDTRAVTTLPSSFPCLLPRVLVWLVVLRRAGNGLLCNGWQRGPRRLFQA
jgi:hypothetical protein